MNYQSSHMLNSAAMLPGKLTSETHTHMDASLSLKHFIDVMLAYLYGVHKTFS